MIEDESDVLYSIRYFLVKKGYRVSTAENGSEGWQLISQSTGNSHPIDLIITDIMLPDINGLELVKRIKQHDLHIPVLVTTALDAAGLYGLPGKTVYIGCVTPADKRNI